MSVAPTDAPRRRRQWGSEAPRPPLPAVPKPASHLATWMGGFAITVTIVLWLIYLLRTVVGQIIDYGLDSSAFLAQMISYVVVMSLLTFSALMYLLARQGALYRTREHLRVPRAEIDAHFSHSTRSMTVIIPSYREEAAVVRATIMSAALQEFPHMRIVLLIDDPPNPTDPDAIEGLAACRALPGEVREWMSEPRERFVAALERAERAWDGEVAVSGQQLRDVALEYLWAAEWLSAEATRYPRESNEDDFVADEVLAALGRDLQLVADALFGALDEGAAVPARRVIQLYRRLAWTFSADIDSFERKTYANLSHDANKAMNLNAYFGLMGRRFQSVDTRLGVLLRETTGDADIVIPDSDYLLTLDADSVLLREYCLRLVYHLELPGNERIAVIQTPYSAFRGASTRLERIAGATTDIQHQLHQGLCYYGATFWVGANAIIRKVALKDIEEVSYVDGYEVRRFIQDRTVIEDTESSIDLIAHGWTLHNFPERLSYSATPPDFGSLVVQRARWANGGLLIAPKFWRHIRMARKAGHKVPLKTICLRFNYMASIAWASVGLVFLLLFPYNSALLSPVILAAALPYFIAMSQDLKSMGYRRSDVFRIYGFNLILLAVNLGGTLKSLQQAAAKSKLAFARTPKVKDRTAAPALYVLFAYLIAVFSAYSLHRAWRDEAWSNAAFAAFNGLLSLYAIVAYIGLRNSIVDVGVGMVNWVRVPVREPKKAQPASPATPEGYEALPVRDWESVLYYGAEPNGAVRTTGPRPQGGQPSGERRSRHRGPDES